MLVTAHLLAGSAIGSLVSNLPLAVILALISHYALDFVPHLDPGTIDMSKRREYFWAALDILSAGSIFYFVLEKIGETGVFSVNIWTAGVFAVLPDFLDNLPIFSSWLHQFFPFDRIYNFHDKIQEPGKKYWMPWGIISQVLIIGFSLFILLR